MLVLGLEDHARVLQMCVFRRSRYRLMHHDSRPTTHYIVGPTYDWALAMMDCPDLMRCHLIKVFIYQATIVVERITRWLRGVWVWLDGRWVNLVLMRYLI